MFKNAVQRVILLALAGLAIIAANVYMAMAQEGGDPQTTSWKSTSLDEIRTVRGVIYDWIKAWQNKDLDGYMSHYSPEFRTGALDYHSWRAKKAGIFKRPGAIDIEISDLWIYIENEEAKASFIQDYTDTNLSDVGQKHLRLVRSKGVWRIVSEEWKAIPKKKGRL